MNDATSSLPVYHPVFGASAPTLDQLRDRCDARGRRVLEGAMRLASRRIQGEQLLQAVRRDLYSPPWSRTTGAKSAAFHVSHGMLPEDALRALLALETDLVAGFVPEPSEEFNRQAMTWRETIEQTEQIIDPLELEESWARRWAIADLEHGTPAVTINYWVASLSYDTLKGLAPLSDVFAEGLRVDPELQRELVERSSALVGQTRFRPLQPAYYDRHDGLRALDIASMLHQGIVLVGEPESGRTALLEAWLQRLSLNQGPARLNGLPVFVNPFDDRDREGRIWETAARERGCIVALTPNGRRAFFDSRDIDPNEVQRTTPERVWDYEPEYTAGAPQTNLVNRLAKITAEPGSNVWVVVVLTRDEREMLVRQVPEVAQFEAVEVPEPADLDRLPIWLCHIMDRPQLGIVQALAIMQAMRPSDIVQARPWLIEPLLGSSLARNLYRPDMLERLRPPSWLRTMIRRVRQGNAPWQKEMLGPKRKFIDRFIGSDARLISLVELDERLHREGLAGTAGEMDELGLEDSTATASRLYQEPPASQLPLQVPDASSLPRDLFLVYRGHHEGPTGKRVVKLPGRSVLEWFQIGWDQAGASGDPAAWVNEACGGEVMGLADVFEAVDDEGLDTPREWQQLGLVLSEHLYSDNPQENVHIDEETLSVHIEHDDEEVAYSFFTRSYAEHHPERTAFLTREDWRLPEDYGQGGFTCHIPLQVLEPSNDGEGTTYLCLLAYGDERPMQCGEPYAFQGVRLPDFASYLRRVVPVSQQRRVTGGEEWFDTWPAQVRLLRAMLSPHDMDFADALSRCNQFPLDFVLANTPHTRLGIGPHGKAKEEFLEAASDARGRNRDPAKTLIVTSRHMAQMLLHLSEMQGFQQWIIFDDLWASAHPDLARSVLHYASGWDPLLASRPER